MPSGRAGDNVIGHKRWDGRLHRIGRTGNYQFSDLGVRYRVVRTTDGSAPSVVIWDVHREDDRSFVKSFTTLTDLRLWRPVGTEPISPTGQPGTGVSGDGEQRTSPPLGPEGGV